MLNSGCFWLLDRQVEGQRHGTQRRTSQATNGQVIIYIKSLKKEKLAEKINTLLNNLLLPNSLCGAAGCRNYLHLFPFKTSFLPSLSFSPPSVHAADSQSLVAFLPPFLSSSYPGRLHSCLLVIMQLLQSKQRTVRGPAFCGCRDLCQCDPQLIGRESQYTVLPNDLSVCLDQCRVG